MIVKYNVVDDSNPTMLYMCMSEDNITINGATMFDKIELDGVEISISDLDTAQGQYQLSEGEHIVKYTLKDPTLIGVEIIDESTQQENIGATFIMCTAISEIKIPNSVITIGNSAFMGCSSLTNVVIPDSVTTIGDAAFHTCTNLTSITIPNSVTIIGPNAFSNCSSLTSITIGNSVTTIDDFAFSSCSGLASITVQATTPPTLSNTNAFTNTNNCPIYVPSASVETYKSATNWSSLSSRIQAIS
jgi:hypothetical protein